MEESQGRFAQCYSVDRFEGVRSGRGLMRETESDGQRDRVRETNRQTDRQTDRDTEREGEDRGCG